MQTLKILQPEVDSLASVVLQPTAQQGGVFTIIGGTCCFYVNQIGQVVPNLNLLKDRINISHQINEAKIFYWMDIFPGLGNWFNKVWGSVHPFVLFCLFILIIICVFFSLCRSLGY